MAQSLVDTALKTLLAFAICLADAPRPEAVVLPDCGGPIQQVVIAFEPAFSDHLHPFYRSLFDTLPSTVCVHVYCPNHDAVWKFLEIGGDVLKREGREVHLINVNTPITIWARDRRIARAHPTTLVESRSYVPPPQWGQLEERTNELTLLPQLALKRLAPWLKESPVQIEGGNLVSSGRHAFIGRNVFEGNSLSVRVVRAELARVFGTPLLVLGDGLTDLPHKHVDMYLTPLDDKTVLAASMNEAIKWLPADALTSFFGNALDPPAFAQQAAQWDARLVPIIAQLQENGYEVVRIPALIAGESEWMATYNNVLMETRDGQRLVYLPVYGNSALDERAAQVFTEHGYTVNPVDVSRVYRLGGAVRCLVNVVRRGPVDEPSTHLPTHRGGLHLHELPPPFRGHEDLPDAPAVDKPADVDVQTQGVLTVSAAAPSSWTLETAWWLPLIIFFARVADVPFGTMRMACVLKRQRRRAFLFAFIESSIWVLAVSSVIQYMDNGLHIVAFAAGYATGSIVGMWMDETVSRRLAVADKQVSPHCLENRNLTAITGGLPPDFESQQVAVDGPDELQACPGASSRF